MATQDRFAPGSSVGLLEFGAISSGGFRSRFVLNLITAAAVTGCTGQRQKVKTHSAGN